MTKADKDEMREMLTDILSGHIEKIDGKFNLIDEKLERIESQTTKTNGRVNRLETVSMDTLIKQKEHIINCPLNERVKTLEGDVITSKTIRKMFIQGFTILGIIGGLVFGIYEIITKL
jgi:hypothetical protein